MTVVDKSLFTPTPVFRARRKRVVVRVQVEGSAGQTQDAMVRDISAAGMSAVARLAPLVADDVVSVALPDGSTLWGIVRWTEGKAFGVEFDKGSHTAPVNGLLAG
ncbi:PilZ domain-containing protein [Novosphingobium piscinae]|uniref:PilZ domain-containing protein n=1 Tax=Novosphingobium piscinae TaxID=1507448 RepID=A0A7X1G1P1_9SPHN|nr:PilZ domain-containing protein [Novosphingobium piscinae]MBC2670367.1 PilZ domain-containing protein [Novosphingobium piscinae]